MAGSLANHDYPPARERELRRADGFNRIVLRLVLDGHEKTTNDKGRGPRLQRRVRGCERA